MSEEEEKEHSEGEGWMEEGGDEKGRGSGVKEIAPADNGRIHFGKGSGESERWRNRKTESEQNRMNHRTDDSVVVFSFLCVCIYPCLFVNVSKFQSLHSCFPLQTG